MQRLPLFVIIGFFVFFPFINGYNQEANFNKNNPDSIYFAVRKMAFEGAYDSARHISNEILKSYPDYTDFKILIASTYAWEQKYDTAQYLYGSILNTDSTNKPALLGLVDIYLWQTALNLAQENIDKGFDSYPRDSGFTEKQQKLDSLLVQLQQDSLQGIPEITIGKSYKNEIGATYLFDFFKQPYIARRHILSVEYIRHTAPGTLIGRLNTGDNVLNGEDYMQDPSYQAEIDFYPVLSSNSYLYLNYGMSTGNFFPSHRAGGEYYRGLNQGFTISGGFRYMRWEDDIVFLTGSVSKYIGENWISFRPFLAITGKDFANTYLLEGRRYFNAYRSYLFLLMMYGDSPDQPSFLVEEFGNFKSARISSGVNYRINRWLLKFALGYQYEEFSNNVYRNRYDIRVGFQYGF